MRTAAEKKRLTWLLIAIFFFFANLIFITVLLFNGFFTPKPAAPAGGTGAAGTAPSAQTVPSGG
jgi:hypothetical protein